MQLTVIDLIIKMVAKAPEDNPSVNCTYVDGGLVTLQPPEAAQSLKNYIENPFNMLCRIDKT